MQSIRQGRRSVGQGRNSRLQETLIRCAPVPSSETVCRLFVRLFSIDFRIKGAAERDRETLNLTGAGWSLGNEGPRRQWQVKQSSTSSPNCPVAVFEAQHSPGSLAGKSVDSSRGHSYFSRKAARLWGVRLRAGAVLAASIPCTIIACIVSQGRLIE